MKHFMLRSLMLLSVLLSSLGISTAWAQLEGGKVYNFANLGSTGNSMTFTGMSDVSVATTNTEDVAQLWYVIQNQDKSYSLRNLATGKYLRSSNATSNKWTLVNTIEDNCKFNIYTAGNGYTLRATNTTGDYNYMHYGASNGAVVCWEINATATHWGFNKVEIPTEDLQETFNNLSNLSPEQATINSYQQALDNLFEDKGCTILKSAYQTEDALTASSHYQDLPAKLQAMALKVCGGEWTENNYDSNKSEWDSDYAKKYRVQLYEPYNEPEAAASALGLNAHTNLNNPTGIFGGAGEPIYVMVDGTIDEGASLYITYYTGHGKLSGYSYGFELHTGLNVIPSYVNGTNFCINYVVHTFDTSKGKGNKAKARKLSGYKDLKIHIEGGYINGYYNKMGDDLYTPDKNADWDYIAARATQKDVTILGKYITLQFPLNDADTEGNKGLGYYLTGKNLTEAVIDEWDNVMLWERLLLGVLDKNTINAQAKKSPYSIKNVFEYTGEDGEFESDYSDYYNVHGLSFGVGGNSYMYGSWDHCGYHYNTMESIIQNLLTNAGSHWGPGHEIGHQHQELLNMRGLTEVTNNLFSNVVLWYFGETTSRYNGSEGALSEVLKQFNAEGTDFFSNNIWGQTIMYYKLFLYYHVLGHNPKFYPLLFEMLRQDPMTIGYDQDGSKCLMHFYKKCCLAAGEDLTEFFRAHGFFEVMDNRYVGDYSNAVYNLTQAQINAAIAEVKAQAETNGWKENIAVLFITDATRETIKSHKGDNLTLYGETTICAEVGSYSTFNNNEAANYTYSISGTTVTMEGTGGVGFAILNEKGELLGFSDKKTFNISAEAAAAIASGKASIVTFKGDNSSVAATNVMDAGNTEAKYALLGELLDNAKTLLDLSDPTGTKVGYYRASSLTNLQEAYESAKAVYDAQTIAAYSAVYDVLYQEYANLLNNDYARINITEGYAYRLTNKAYPGRSMAVNTENHQMFGIATAESDAQLWYFEPGATKGTYYLKNKSTNKYPGDASSGAVLSANKSEADKGNDNGAYAYRLQSMGNGIFALVGKTGLHCSASQSYNIVGWGADAAASQWYITAAALDEALEARTKLEELIGKTEALINEMADVQIKGNALDLSTCTITSNTPESGHETQYLVDGDPNTFFHTNWKGTAISANHNIIIDLGEGNSLEQFVLNYTTLPSTQNNVDAPKEIHIYGSNNESSYTWFASLTDLPTEKGATYTSNILGTIGTAYRYLRFDVTDATGGKLGSYYYFGLAELSLTNPQPIFKSTLPAYTESETTIKTACSAYYTASLTYNNGSATKAELDAATEALSEKYNDLLAAYNNVKNASLDAKKTELQKLIDDANTLIDECGSVKYTEETTPQLNVTAAPYMLSDNNVESEGSLEKLYDGKQGKDFSYTSNWEHALSESPYLQVDLGTGNELEELIFTFTNRTEGNAPTPTEIVVSASADGNNFTTLTTFTSEKDNLPPAANNQSIAATKWTSPVIEATSACRYWRFTVTKSQRSSGKETNNKGIYHFGISEFGIVIPAGCKITVNEGMGGVTEELLLATYDENQEANSTLTYATTEAQLDKAIADLQAQYDALAAAKKVVDKEPLIQLIVTATEKLAACGTVTPNGEELDVEFKEETAGSVNKNMLRELYRAIEDAQEVIDNTKATQEEVNAEITELTAQMDIVQEAQQDETKAKQNLKAEIDEMEKLLAACEENPGSASQQLIEECQAALQTAQGIYNADDTTVDGYADAVAPLNTKRVALAEAKGSPAKADLKTAIDGAQTAIDACASSITKDGDAYTVVWNFETAGDVDKATLIAAYEALAQANEVYNGNASTVSEYEAAKTALGTPITTLNAYQQGLYKATLGDYVSQVAGLIANCEETRGDLTNDMYDDIVQCHATASAYLTQEFATHGELVNDITSAIQYIEDNIGTWSAAQQSTAKAELLDVIAELEKLIGDCRANGTKTITTDVPCALQTTDGADFYISTNATATEGDIANLVDGKMNTSFQTKNSVGAEQHYLLVDAGAGKALKKFKFSYRTNKSFFPYTIVVYGSNDKEVGFKELATFSKDDENPLPTSADQLWISSEIESVTAYRYLRFNITKSGIAIKVDDNKDIDTSKGEQLSNKFNASLYAETPQGEYCFAMSEFDLIRRVDNEGVQLTEAQQAIQEANDLVTNSADATELGNKKTELERLYNNLSEPLRAASQRIQVTLTTTDAKRDELLSGIEFGQTIGTFSAPYATVIPEGVTAYYAEQAYEGGTVSLTPIKKGKALPAEEGVILIGEVGVNSVMFIPATDETADLSLNKFSNSATSSEYMEDNDYILANGEQGIGFYQATPNSILKQGKAFFRILDHIAPPSFVLRFDGNTTDIDAVTTGTPSDDELIYDIYGRRVIEVKKGGIYIKNGKKFLVK